MDFFVLIASIIMTFRTGSTLAVITGPKQDDYIKSFYSMCFSSPKNWLYTLVVSMLLAGMTGLMWAADYVWFAGTTVVYMCILSAVLMTGINRYAPQ